MSIKTVYIAGKDRHRAQAVAISVEAVGITPSCRWWEDINRYSPEREREAISKVDALIYLWEHDQESARYEVGMALAHKIPVIAVHPRPEWFMTLPNVVQLSTDAEIMGALTGDSPLQKLWQLASNWYDRAVDLGVGTNSQDTYRVCANQLEDALAGLT